MSDIRQVDAAFHAKRIHAERSSVQDFAHELAKTGDGKTTDNGHLHGSPAVNQSMHAVAITPKPPIDVSHAMYASPSTSDVVVASVATGKQLSEAVQPTGITEALLGSRVYGVHLLASTYLSELVAREDPNPEAVPDVTQTARVNTPSSPHAVLSDAPSNVIDTIPDAPFHQEVVAVLSMLMKGEANEATSRTQSSSSVSVVSAEASTMLWPESSIRLTKQCDGSAVIWLRDYRMPHEGASQVVDVLAKGAKTAGIRLGRIVLNGREVWTSSKNY